MVNTILIFKYNFLNFKQSYSIGFMNMINLFLQIKIFKTLLLNKIYGK